MTETTETQVSSAQVETKASPVEEQQASGDAAETPAVTTNGDASETAEAPTNGTAEEAVPAKDEKPVDPPKEMRAIVLTGFGGLKGVKILKKPEPALQAGEVMIRVKACGLNFQDLMVRLGAIDSPPKTPCILGFECAGEVEELGEDVEDLKVGDRVVALPEFRAWAELVAVPSKYCYKIPDDMSYTDAAAIAMNYLVAYIVLFDLACIQPGKSLLLHSAGGGVGIAIAQLCRTVDNITIFGSCSKGKHEVLKETGLIDHLLERGTDYCNEVRKVVTEGVDIVLDCLCGEECNRGYSLLKPMGKLILYGSSNVVTGETKSFFSVARSWWQVDKVSPIKLFDENKCIAGFNLRHFLYQQDGADYIKKTMDNVLQLWRDGKIKPTIDSTWALEDVAEAMQKMHDRKNIGKLILDPSMEPKPKPATPAKGKAKDKKQLSEDKNGDGKDKKSEDDDKKDGGSSEEGDKKDENGESEVVGDAGATNGDKPTEAGATNGDATESAMKDAVCNGEINLTPQHHNHNNNQHHHHNHHHQQQQHHLNLTNNNNNQINYQNDFIDGSGDNNISGLLQTNIEHHSVTRSESKVYADSYNFWRVWLKLKTKLDEIQWVHFKKIHWMNKRAAPGCAYMPSEIEHLANVLTHGFWVVPAIIGGIHLVWRSQSSDQKLAACIYGTALALLFTVSTFFHCVFYCNRHRQLKDVLHRCDRAMIYVFIAGSYFPWLILSPPAHPTILFILRWMVWLLAGLGILYQQIYHERYKCLETLLYVVMGLGPSLVIIIFGHEFIGMSELKLGGLLYILGIFFFKADGSIPFAHAIWHLFVVLAASVHYFAILKYLYPTLNQ